jgi:hypothetical protein
MERGGKRSDLGVRWQAKARHRFGSDSRFRSKIVKSEIQSGVALRLPPHSKAAAFHILSAGGFDVGDPESLIVNNHTAQTPVR